MSSNNLGSALGVMGKREWGLLGLLSLLWGGSFFFIGVAIREVPFLTLVAIRVVVGALALHMLLRVRSLRFPLAAPILLAFLGIGILNNVIPFSLIAFGQSRIESGLASILNATTPLFTVLFAHLLTTDEKLTAQKVVGVLLGILGVAILFGFRGLGSGSIAETLGQAACLGAAISYGFAGIFGRRFARLGIHPFVTAAGQLTASSLVMLPLSFAFDQPWTQPMPSLASIAALLALAVFSTAGGYLVFFQVLAKAGATNISLVTLLVPCSAILLGAAFLDEALTVSALIGFLAIASGLLLIDGRFFRFLRGIVGYA